MTFEYSDPKKVHGVVPMARAHDRADQPAAEMGLDSFAFRGKLVNGGAPILNLPAFDARESWINDRPHLEIVTRVGKSELTDEQRQLISDAFERIEGISFSFVDS